MKRAMIPMQLVALCAAMVLAACAQPSESLGEPKAQAVTVTADDAGWTTVGTQGLRAGWVSFTLETLEGEADHGLQLIRFKNGGTIKQLIQADDEEFLRIAEPMGGFVGVTGAETHTFTIDLAAGSYVMLDFGGTQEEGPNFLRGMTASFEVALGEGTAGVRPVTDGEIVMREFAIDLPEGFTGQGTYLVRNAGGRLHELNIGRLPPGADAGEEIRRHARTGRGRMTEMPGLAVVAPGTEAYLELDLSAGSYAFACFLEEPGDPEVHALKGMYTQVTVG